MNGPKTASDFVDNFAPYLINQVANRWNYDFNKMLKAQRQINLSEWRIMAVVRARPNISISELIKHVTMDQPTVSRIVDRLVERELLVRDLKSDDRRFVELFLTPTGLETVDKIWPIAMQFYQDATSSLTASEVDTLVRLLKKVRSGFDGVGGVNLKAYRLK